MKLKEHSIFKSYLYLTREEEKAWRQDITAYLNEDIGEEEPYTEDDYTVTEKLYDDINDSYECEQMNLNMKLPNRIIAIASVGRWNGRFNGGKIMGNNLNEVLFTGQCDELKVYYDRYNVHSVMSHHDGSHYVTYRMVKENVDPEWLLDKQVYGDGLTSQEITRYTKSLVPYIKEVYGI